MVVNYADLVSQLRATLGRMEVALGAIADAIVWTGKDGRVQWCNAAFDRLVNQPHILVLGAKLTDLLALTQASQPIAPESYPHVKVLSGKYEVTEYEFQSLARSLVLEISGNGVDLGDGNPSAVLVIRDVTQAKRLEAERQRVEREREEYLSLLRATLESTADGIVVVDMERNVPVYNQKFLQIWSIPESLLLPGTSDARFNLMAKQTSNPDAFIDRIREIFTQYAEQEVYDLVELKNGRIFERYSQPQWKGDRVIGRVWSFRDITERKLAEEALRQSEARFRAVFESAAIGCSLASLDGSILHVNPAFQKMLGYSEAELRSMKFMEFTHPDDMAANMAFAQEVIAGVQESFQLEKRYIRKDGKVVWGRLTLSAIRKADSAIEYLVALIENISDRKQAEVALRQSESRYRALVTASAQSVFTTNAAGEVIESIPLWQALTGQSEAQVKGMGWLDCIHPDDREPTMQAWFKAINTGSLYEVEQRIRIATGDYRLFLVRGVPVLDDQGNIREWVGTQTDITDRKRAEEALRLSELKYRNIFENSQVGIGRTRLEDGLFLDVNQRYAEIMGFSSAAELIGKRFNSEFYANPSDREQILAELQQYGEVRNFEEQLRRPDGSTAWVLLSLRLNAEESCIDFVIADITDRKRAEEALRRSELKYRNIFENSQFGIVRAHLEDGLFIDTNQRFAEILGFSCAKDLMGHSSTEFYANPNERQRVLAELQQGDIRNFELLLRQLDGSLIWTLLSIRLNTEESCLESVITDITDRKRAEEALRRSELKFRNLFENSLVGMFRSRIEDGLILDANQRAAELFGFGCVAEVIGKRFSTEFYANPDDRQRMLTQLHQFGEVNNFEVQVCRRDRAMRWMMVSLRLNLEENCMEGVVADITDRKRAEVILHQREQEFRALAENAPDVIIRFDRQSRYLYINPRVEREIGIPPSAFLGKTVREMGFSQEVVSWWETTLGLVFETGEEHKTEFEVPFSQAFPQKALYLSFRLVPEFGSDGSVESVLAVCRDLTERKQAEEALRQSEARFRALYESISIAVLIQEDGIPIDCNRAAEQLFSYSRQELLSKHPKELSPPFQPNGQESISFANQQIALAYEQGNNRFEWVHRRADGSDFPAEVRLTVFEVGDRKLVQGIVQDFTEQKQAEAILQHRAQVDSLLSSISRQFIDQDVDTAINFALQQVGKFTSSDRSYVFRFHTNRTLLKNTHEWCADGIEPFINEPHDCIADSWSCQILLSGGVLDVPDVNHLPPEAAQDQADWKHQSIVSLLIVPMIHVGEVVGCVGLDAVRRERIWSEETIRLLKLIGEITAIGLARHTAEEAMRVAKEAAEVANRAKSTFLANMSHELRTPLNAILGFAQLMERDSSLTPRQRESLTIINRSGEHLLNLINDVLEMSRIEAGRVTLNLTPFNLHQLLQAIWEMFQLRAAAKQLSLQFELAPDLPQYVLTDEGKLRQILINLLSNAVKFTHTGGVLLQVSWVTSSASSDSHGEEVQRTTDDGQRTIYFEVEDTGRGIAPEEIDSLFQPFVQTTSGTEAREGTGLGLTISRQFVQLMGGDIHVTSNLGQGSTFCFDVQVTLANPADVAPTPTYRRVLKLAPNQSTYRILVVDDRQESRDLMAQLLKLVGFEIRGAENGQEAIAQWQTWHPHLIWMDMRMPVMDGYEATRQIRTLERHRTAPSYEPTVIIALTASAFEEQQASIIAVGCDDFVRKPFREQVIFEKITQYLKVQYIYEEQDAVERTKDEQCNCSSSPILYPSSLQVMPTEWIASIYQAALAVDADRILELIEQIPQTHLALAEGLTELVNHFCFDEILELAGGE